MQPKVLVFSYALCLGVLVEFCHAHHHARPHNHHTLDFCNPCTGRGGRNNTHPAPIFDQDSFDLLRLSLYSKLVDIQSRFNNAKVILLQKINETTDQFNVNVLIHAVQTGGHIVSPSLRMYNLLKEVSHFTRLTLNPFANRHGLCLQNLWHQSDVEIAMCFLKRLMSSRNIQLTDRICKENIYVELVTESHMLRTQISTNLDAFTDKINDMRRLLLDAEREWCTDNQQ